MSATRHTGRRRRGARAYCRVLDRQAAVRRDCEFLAFAGAAPLVAHNAGFDIAFLNAELKRAAKQPIAAERVVDHPTPPTYAIRLDTS
jgi:hypothetical protein